MVRRYHINKAPSPSISFHIALSVFSFLCLRLMSDRESTTLKWRDNSTFPKVEMRDELRIPIAIDQRNGRDFERLISLGQSVWSWRLLQRPRERTMASEILPAIPQGKGVHLHTHITFTFASNILLYLYRFIKHFFLFSTQAVFC